MTHDSGPRRQRLKAAIEGWRTTGYVDADTDTLLDTIEAVLEAEQRRCSSTAEHRPVEPKVAGSTPASVATPCGRTADGVQVHSFNVVERGTVCQCQAKAMIQGVYGSITIAENGKREVEG